MIRNNEYFTSLMNFFKSCGLIIVYESDEDDISSENELNKENRLILTLKNDDLSPIFLRLEFYSEEEEVFLITYFIVRTYDFMFDGDRSDIHDFMSTILAIIARIVSPYKINLIDFVYSFVSDNEIHSRALLIEHSKYIDRTLDDKIIEDIEELFFIINCAITFIFLNHEWGKDSNILCKSTPAFEAWVTGIEGIIYGTQNNILSNCNLRSDPQWQWFLSGNVSIFKINYEINNKIFEMLDSLDKEFMEGIDRMLIRFNEVHNSISKSDIELAKRLLNYCEGNIENSRCLSIENMFFVLGHNILICVRSDCSKNTYDMEKNKILDKYKKDMQFLRSNSKFIWSDTIDPGEFEELVCNILKEEPNVVRSKLVGPVNQADGGRDIMIDKIIINHSDIVEEKIKDSIQHKKILVQCKAYSRPVGKSHVIDIRDTIEHYDADGYILVVSSKITVPLFDHLSKMRDQGKYFIDWWDKEELEDKLRHNPTILDRYNNIVKICESS